MKLFSKAFALLAGVVVLGAGTLTVNAATTKTTTKTKTTTMMGGHKVVHVKGYVRHMKSGKTVMVHGYNRTVIKHPMMGTKTVVVHSSMRHMKNGKIVAVKAHTRKMVKPMMKMKMKTHM